MSRKEMKRYKYDTQYLDDYVTEHGSEDDMTVSLGGRRRTRKRRRKKRTKKERKREGEKRTRRK